MGSDRAIAMQRAVQGQRGYGEAIDYRGFPVAAAWSYLPSYRWGMVVKQDTDEAFARVPAAFGRRHTPGGDDCAGHGHRPLAGANNHLADPRGRDGNRPGRFR